MVIILRVLALTLLCNLVKPTVSSHWMRKTQKNINLKQIFAKYENIPITSCQIKCRNDKRCKSIGLQKEADLGALVDCNLIRESEFRDSKTASVKLYVVEKIEIRNDSPTPLSCQTLYESNPSLKNGMYRINPSNPVNVYCNMGFASRGWMMIANVTVDSPLTKEQAKQLTSKHKISTSITELYQVGSGTFRFNPRYLSDLDAEFQFLHFFCSKPNGKRVDITTTKKEVLDYFMLKTNNRPEACGSFTRTDSDNSTLANDCAAWRHGKWGLNAKTNNRLYNHPFWIPGKHHYLLLRERMECDDRKNTNSLYGVWRIWVS